MLKSAAIYRTSRETFIIISLALGVALPDCQACYITDSGGRFGVCSGWGRGVLGVSEKASAAAPRGGLDRSALDLDIGLLCTAGRGPGAHSLLDLSCHSHEGLLHVGGILGAGLQEGNAQGVCEFLEKRATHQDCAETLAMLGMTPVNTAKRKY